jgi:predicted porin
MKKTLVALAALASVSAFAQTSVVIDGFIDRGYLTTNNTNDTADLKTIGSNSGTTTFGVKVREDLGAGLSAGISINTDWSELGGNTAGNAVANAQASGFANSQSFLDITSKDMGTLRLGTPNTFTLTNATGVASPAFSTGVGSQYSSAYAIAAGAGTGTSGRGGTVDFTGTNTATQNWSTSRAIRIANTIQYSSPSFNGVTVNVGYTQANNNVLATTTLGAGNTPGVAETAIRYTNGPIDAMYSTIKYTVGSNGMSQNVNVCANGVCTQTVDTNAAQTSTQNLLGVAYTVMPTLKLNFGSGTYSSSTGTYQGSSKNYGATYTMGQIDLMVLTSASDDKGTTNFDKKMTGYGLNYNLSKQTRAYVRMDNLNYGSNVASVSGSSVKRTAFGVSKSF